MKPMSTRSTSLIVLLFDSLADFFLSAYSYQLLGKLLKFTMTNVYLSISFSTVNFYFIYFEGMLLAVVSYFLHHFVTSVDQMFNIAFLITT